MGNACASATAEDANVDAETALEKDPAANFTSLVERRFIVWAEHPVTRERLRAHLLRKNVDTLEVDDDDEARGRSFHVRWGRYWLEEPGSDSLIDFYDEREHFNKTPSALFNHYLSFVQTVGSPGFEYSKMEHISCKDHTDQWHPAIIKNKEENYYFVEYDRKSKLESEWIHKYSTRLRKVEDYGYQRDHGGELWDTFYELDWIRVRHPINNTHLPAKIVSKDEKDENMVVQYDDPSLLIRQETLHKEQLEDDYKKVEYYAQWKKRWRYNRLYIYQGALKAVGLLVHAMSAANGHSLFRALSHQLFGTEENFLYVRRRCLDHISTHKDYFANFVDINFEYYLAHKRKGLAGEWFSLGDHLDIQAVCEMFDCRVEIYSELSPRPLETVRFYQQMTNLPLVRLSYRGGGRYDSVSHVDSPLPITVDRHLRQVPLGTVFTEQFIILKARNKIFEAAKPFIAEQLSDIHDAKETLSVTVMAYVEFPPNEIHARLKQLLKEVGLESSIKETTITGSSTYKAGDKHSIDPNVQVVFQSSGNRNIRISYPATPWIPQPEEETFNPAQQFETKKKQVPLMKIEGLKQYVDKAMAFVKIWSKKSVFRVISMGSRVHTIVHKKGDTIEEEDDSFTDDSAEYSGYEDDEMEQVGGQLDINGGV